MIRGLPALYNKIGNRRIGCSLLNPLPLILQFMVRRSGMAEEEMVGLLPTLRARDNYCMRVPLVRQSCRASHHVRISGSVLGAFFRLGTLSNSVSTYFTKCITTGCVVSSTVTRVSTFRFRKGRLDDAKGYIIVLRGYAYAAWFGCCITLPTS